MGLTGYGGVAASDTGYGHCVWGIEGYGIGGYGVGPLVAGIGM